MTPKSIWHTREELVLQIITLAQSKTSRRAIARAVGVSRNTVKQVLREHATQRSSEHSALPQTPVRAPRHKKIDAMIIINDAVCLIIFMADDSAPGRIEKP